MRRKRKTLVIFMGMVATVLAHLLLFAAMWSNGQLLPYQKLPGAVVVSAHAGWLDSDPGERRMVVSLTPEFETSTPPEPVPPPSTPLKRIEFGDATAKDQDHRQAARARYASIYESQILSAVQRTWELPDGAASDPDFSCRVRIRLQPDGQVREVGLDLSECSGSSAWQQSLVKAIQLASPLPAPPDPSAFVDNLVLEFHSSAERRMTLP